MYTPTNPVLRAMTRPSTPTPPNRTVAALAGQPAGAFYALQGSTPDQVIENDPEVARRRQIIAAMQPQTGAVQGGWAEGLARLAQSGVGALATRAQNRQVDARKQAAQETLTKAQALLQQDPAQAASLLLSNPDTSSYGQNLQAQQAVRAQTLDDRQAVAQRDARKQQAALRESLLKSQLAANKPTADIQEYNFARQQGFGGSFMDWQQQQKPQGTNITVNAGDATNPNILSLSKAPPGFVYQLDGNGQLMFDENGAPRMVPIPGSPQEQKIQQAQTKEQGRQLANIRNASLAINELGRAIQEVEDSPIATSGTVGGILRGFPGSKAFNVRNLLEPVQAIVSFDALQDMRDNSPTGGALGQVTEFELRLLQATLGSLDQAQTKGQLLPNLKRLYNDFAITVNGPNANLPYPEIAASPELLSFYRAKAAGNASGVPLDPYLFPNQQSQPPQTAPATPPQQPLTLEPGTDLGDGFTILSVE